MDRSKQNKCENEATHEADKDHSGNEFQTLSVLDDSLGALDASTANKVFDGLFKAEVGVLRGCRNGVVWVTHAVHFLPRPEITKILVLDANGSMRFCGSWSDLEDQARNDSLLAETMTREDSQPTFSSSSTVMIRSPSSQQQLIDLVASAVAPTEVDTEAEASDAAKTTVEEREADTEIVETCAADEDLVILDADGKECVAIANPSPHDFKKSNTSDAEKRNIGMLVREEKREVGVASLETWKHWVEAAGGGTFLFVQFLTLSLDRATCKKSVFHALKLSHRSH